MLIIIVITVAAWIVMSFAHNNVEAILAKNVAKAPQLCPFTSIFLAFRFQRCYVFIIYIVIHVLHTALWQRSGWSWGTDGCCQTRFETGKFHQNFSFCVSISLLLIGTVKNIVTAYCFANVSFFLQSKERGSTQAASLHDELTNSKVNIYKLYLINNPLRHLLIFKFILPNYYWMLYWNHIPLSICQLNTI